MILTALTTLIAFRSIKRKLRSNTERGEAGLARLLEKPDLSQIEADVMKLFARENGKMLYGPEIAYALSINNLRASDALDKLVERDFLDPEMNVLRGTGYNLTRTGRDYLLSTGLA